MVDSVYLLLYGKSFGLVAVLAAIAAVIWTAIGSVMMKNHRKAWRVINALLAAALAFIIIIMTLTSREKGNYGINLIPFDSFMRSKQEPELLRSFFFNMVLFFPLGLTCPYALGYYPKKAVPEALAVLVIFSIIIETCQFVFKLGFCETDDVIANALGAALGACIWLLTEWISSALKPCDKRSKP
ncbi:MAG: VanZ family protein [Acutalibacteraceae bacterium]